MSQFFILNNGVYTEISTLFEPLTVAPTTKTQFVTLTSGTAQDLNQLYNPALGPSKLTTNFFSNLTDLGGIFEIIWIATGTLLYVLVNNTNNTITQHGFVNGFDLQFFYDFPGTQAVSLSINPCTPQVIFPELVL